MQQSSVQERRCVLKVYTIIDKPGSEKGIWLEVGLANKNRDGSLRVKLDALPVNGTLHIREYESKKSNFDRPNGEQQQPHGTWRRKGESQ